ncbi:Chaperone protein dnaJ 49-like protein [Drosera capensis]
MEGNKNEAAKAKELAEKQFLEKDFAGAKKLAVRAQTLFPSLDGLQEFLAALGIYIAADRKINGQIDWYGILGIDLSADEDTVRKHYRKLALALHPDKNKSVGADGAFKIVSQAWNLLSDKGKKMAYDQKRNQGAIYQKVTFARKSGIAGGNGFCAPATGIASSIRNQQSAPCRFSAPPHTRSLKTDSFWTACTSCWTQYEYLKVYLDQQLLCPNCKKPFLAIQMAPPPGMIHQTRSSHPQQQELNQTTGTDFSPVHGGDQTSSAAEATREETQASFKMVDATKGIKRSHDSEANHSTPESKRPPKRSSPNGQSTNGHTTETTNEMGMGVRAEVGPISESFERGTVEAAMASDHSMKHPGDSREPSFLGTQITKETVEVESDSKLEEYIKSPVLQASSTEEKDKLEPTAEPNMGTLVDSNENPTGNGFKSEVHKDDASVESECQDKPSTILPAVPADPGFVKDVESVLLEMSVQDTELHDFDDDRTEKCFGEKEVWAVYDDEDGMPRRYALVDGVISRRPFRMRMSWLQCKSNVEFGRTNWVGRGFSKTSGDFRTTKKHETTTSINSFSHKVKWKKGPTGAIQIYPQKGDVWALYRNWSPEWNELTSRELIHKYDMVEVLEDYDAKKGMTVIPLVKVSCSKTIFRRHSDPQQVRVIPREEMFRFSHQVPSCFLNGEQFPKALVGFRELDPAAIPL